MRARCQTDNGCGWDAFLLLVLVPLTAAAPKAGTSVIILRVFEVIAAPDADKHTILRKVLGHRYAWN
jgi:hypothetical protein